MLTVRLTLLCVLIFAAGRAGIDLLFAAAGVEDVESLRGRNYVALGLGATIVLLFTWALYDLRLYSYTAIVATLCAFVAAAFIVNGRFRAFALRPWREFDGTFVAWIAGCATFLLSMGLNEYQLGGASDLYIQQGWWLPSGLPPAFAPNFGQALTLPVVYAAHAISAVFAVLGYGDHLAFYFEGTYWIDALFAPLVPVGAYLLFRRFLGPIASAAVAAAFCTITLGSKIWSVRGETLGWIVGFGLLIAVLDLFPAVLRNERRASRLWIIPALLLFGAILTHAVAAMACIILFAFSLRYLVVHWSAAGAGRALRFAVAAGASFALLLVLFDLTYAGSGLFERYPAPHAGSPDAVSQYDDAWEGAPLSVDVPNVRRNPPYAPAGSMIAVVAVLPPLALIRGEAYDDFQLRDFPSLAVDRVNSLPLAVRIGIPLLPCVVGLLYCFGLVRGRDERLQTLFWACLAVYAALVCVALISDMRSVSLYPVAAVRRSFVYCEFFYWLAIASACTDFLPNVPVRRIAGWPMWEAAAPATLTICWLGYMLSASMGRASSAAFLGHLMVRAQAVTGVAPTPETTDMAFILAPLDEAMAFVRAHTRPGEWVYSNVISSENTFSYLTGGRYSLTEGPSNYQQFVQIQQAAHRIRTFVEFALSTDPRLIEPYHVRYVVLYTDPSCRLASCYGNTVFKTNLPLFARSRDYREVFRNSKFVIYKRSDAPPDPRASRIAILLPRCETTAGLPAARISACTNLLGMFSGIDPGQLDPYMFYFRGLAYTDEHRYDRAIADLNRAIVVDPSNGITYFARSKVFEAEGDVDSAISDLEVGEAYSEHIEAYRRELARLRSLRLRKVG